MPGTKDHRLLLIIQSRKALSSYLSVERSPRPESRLRVIVVVIDSVSPGKRPYECSCRRRFQKAFPADRPTLLPRRGITGAIELQDHRTACPFLHLHPITLQDNALFPSRSFQSFYQMKGQLFARGRPVQSYLSCERPRKPSAPFGHHLPDRVKLFAPLP